MTQPIALCGLPVRPGLKPDPNLLRPSGWQKLTYTQPVDNIWDAFSNIGKLTKTENLKGLELLQAKTSNLVAMYVNPFAMAEGWRHLLSTGKMI